MSDNHLPIRAFVLLAMCCNPATSEELRDRYNESGLGDICERSVYQYIRSLLARKLITFPPEERTRRTYQITKEGRKLVRQHTRVLAAQLKKEP